MEKTKEFESYWMGGREEERREWIRKIREDYAERLNLERVSMPSMCDRRELVDVPVRILSLLLYVLADLPRLDPIECQEEKDRESCS